MRHLFGKVEQNRQIQVMLNINRKMMQNIFSYMAMEILSSFYKLILEKIVVIRTVILMVNIDYKRY